jgi:mRNA interferase MazF
MKRGEVRWHQFAPPDKRRPVLLLTRDSVSNVLADVTVAPVTSSVREIDSEVLLTEADGMREVCVVNLDHVQTVQRARMGALIATLRPERMDEVGRALQFALGFRDHPATGP